MTPYLVIAANNNEDTSWVGDLPHYVNSTYHPQGREAYTYLRWMIMGCPDRDVVFVQGDPFKHDPKFMDHLANDAFRTYGTIYDCNSNSGPQYDAPLNSWCDVLGLPRQDTFTFVAGAQYRVTPEQINSRTTEFYEALLKLTFVNKNSPWILERLWSTIWGLEL